MGRTLTEEYLGDAFQLVMYRVRPTPGGGLEWVMRVTYETYDADDPAHPVFNEARDDVLDLLTPAQRTNAINFANTIRDRTAQLLQVAPEAP